MAKITAIKYRMRCDGKSHLGMTALMGCAFFLRVAYYFIFGRPDQIDTLELILHLILPMSMEAAFMVMVRGLKLNLPKVYGIMGAVYCAIFMVQAILIGGVSRIVWASVGYTFCAAALVCVGWSFLRKVIGILVLLAAFGVRLVVFDLGMIRSLQFFPLMKECANLCVILALMLFCAGLVGKKRKIENDPAE